MFEVMKNGILCDGWGEKTIYWLIQGSNLCAVLKLINLSSANFIISSFMEIVPRHIAISKIETINVKLILIMINFIVTGILCFCREFLPSHSFLTNYLFFFLTKFLCNCCTIVNVYLFFFCYVTDEFVAQFKSTIMLLPNGTVLATGIPLDLNLYESEHSVTDEDMKKLLAEDAGLVSTGDSKNKKKRAKKSKSAAAAANVGEKENADDKPAATEKKA